MSVVTDVYRQAWGGKVDAALKSGDPARIQAVAQELAQHANNPKTSGQYANQMIDLLRRLPGYESTPYVDPNRKQQNGPVAGLLQLGGLAAAGIAGGALAGIGPAAGSSALPGVPGGTTAATGVGGLGGDAVMAGAGGLGGLAGAAKKYGPLVLGGLGAIDAAGQYGRADALAQRAQQIAEQDYQARGPLRDAFSQGALNRSYDRPDLGSLYATQNPYRKTIPR